MSSSHGWMKFWPQDWQRDPALRSCGLAARGLWMEMLCIAHGAATYGHVQINGKPATTRQIGMIVGISEAEAAALLAELEDAGVFNRAEDGCIYSRRMVRDKAASEAGRANGKKGGNPKLADRDNPTSERGLTPPFKDQEAEAEAKKDSEAKASDDAAAPSMRDALWRDGIPILRTLTGKSDSQCRSVMGRALRDANDDAARLYGVLREAESLRPADPMAWITAACRRGQGARASPRPNAMDERLRRAGLLVDGPQGNWIDGDAA